MSEHPTKDEKVAHVKAARQDRRHECHWPDCKKQVPPAMWGCSTHWFKLPVRLRNRIWKTHRPGQENDLSPSNEYIAAALEVQQWISQNS